MSGFVLLQDYQEFYRRRIGRSPRLQSAEDEAALLAD